MEQVEKVSRLTHNFSKKHWMWYTIIMAIPTTWLSFIIPIWGNALGLLNEKGEMTCEANMITAIACVIIAVPFFLNNWYSSKSERGKLESLEGEIGYLGTITENVDKICDEKLERLKWAIVSVKEGQYLPPEVVTKPSNQLKRIIIGITECLVKFMKSPGNDYAFKDFLVTIAYDFPQEDNKWQWCDGVQERDLALEELLQEGCDSTYMYLMRTNNPYYFNNSKEDAKRERKYYYNKQDEINAENNEPVGSIFCYNFKIKKQEKVYVNAYLSISTNKKRFSVEDEEICKNTRDNMISLVKDSFGRRISIELSLLYLEYLKLKKELQQDNTSVPTV